MSTMSTINILFLTSVPKDEEVLDSNAEFRQIEDLLDDSPHARRFRLFRHARLRREELERTLTTFHPHIVHFSGHGTESGNLVLEAQDGQRWDLDRDTLRTVFKAYAQSTRLVVLNACHSEVAGNTLREVVPYVVGNAIEVYDTAAVEFSKSFYQTLFAGDTLRKSFRGACQAAGQIEASRANIPQLLNTPQQPDPRDVKPLEQWFAPVDVPPQGAEPPQSGQGTSTAPKGQQMATLTAANRGEARRLISHYCLLDSDLDAFVMECFPDVHKRWSNGMDRVAKINLFLTVQEPAVIAAALDGYLRG